MLENTHRFAIHIRICKEATDEDRATAMGQLRKTKKYGMKVNRKPVTDLDKLMQHPEVCNTINEYLASLVARPASQDETSPVGSSTRNQHCQYPSQQHCSDLNGHMTFAAAPIRDSHSKTFFSPFLGFNEDAYHPPSSMLSSDHFHSYSHCAHHPQTSTVLDHAAAHPAGVTARDTTHNIISDNHNRLDSPDISTTTFYDDSDMTQLQLEPMTQQYVRHCYQTPAIDSHQQDSSSWRAMYLPSFEPQAPAHDPQPFIF
jgi:hypothetical protein